MPSREIVCNCCAAEAFAARAAAAREARMKSRNFIVLPHNGSRTEKRLPRFGDAAREGFRPNSRATTARMFPCQASQGNHVVGIYMIRSHASGPAATRE